MSLTKLPDWQRAFGAPLFHGRLRQCPEDFQVVERLGFDPAGSGDHDWLWVEKTGQNTHWVARSLARHAGVAVRDVGYAGLKDRHAVTRQWFSVPRRPSMVVDWTAFDESGISILETARNARKLRRGSHRGNRFRILLRGSVPADDVAGRLANIQVSGVPNYFGEQRFGRDAGNLALAHSLFEGRRLKREKRSIALSAARSFLFNEILSGRVADATWDRALPGDILNLDGSGSQFPCPEPDATIEERCRLMDLHPTGALWGTEQGAPSASDLEREVARRYAGFAQGLESAGLRMERRPLRVRVSGLGWKTSDDGLTLEFELPRGSFATAVIREIATVDATGND